MKKTKAKTNTNTAKESVSGVNIYKDEKGRTIYFNIFDKNGYVLDGYEKGYKKLSSRYALAAISGIFAFLLNFSVLVSIGVVFFVVIYFEVRFRLFLKRLTIIKGFHPAARVSKVSADQKDQTSKMILRIILLLILVVLIPINAINNNYQDFFLYINYAFTALALLLTLYYSYILYIKLKKSN